MVVRGEDLGTLNETGLALFRRRRIGMIFQFFNLLDDLPALDNVALAAQLTGTSARAGPHAARWSCSTSSGIADRRNAYPASSPAGSGSGSPSARALMNRPALLLADEPTGALDSRSGEQVMDLLLDLNQIGQTLLLVTHDQRLATRCASRLVELADGRIVRERRWSGRYERGLARLASGGAAPPAADPRHRRRRARLHRDCSSSALGLLAAAAGPFDQAYAKQRGAHLVADVRQHADLGGPAGGEGQRRPASPPRPARSAERRLSPVPGQGPR